MSTWHIYPHDDLIEHDTHNDDCVCVPHSTLISGPNGDSWILTHSSLDGRETHEH